MPRNSISTASPNSQNSGQRSAADAAILPKSAFQHFPRIIRRAVVYHHDFEVRPSRSQHARHAFARHGCAVVRRYHDGDSRRAFHLHTPFPSPPRQARRPRRACVFSSQALPLQYTKFLRLACGTENAGTGTSYFSQFPAQLPAGRKHAPHGECHIQRTHSTRLRG